MKLVYSYSTKHIIDYEGVLDREFGRKFGREFGREPWKLFCRKPCG